MTIHVPLGRQEFFQKLLEAEANRRVRMCNLQSAKDCASVKTSLATVHARAQEMGNLNQVRTRLYMLLRACTDHIPDMERVLTRSGNVPKLALSLLA